MHKLANSIAAALLLLLLLLLAPAAPAAAQSSAEPVTLAVQADKPGAKIDRHIFGQFAEHLGTGIYGGVWVGEDSPIPNVRGIRSDVVAALRAIKVPNVRWPGGCFGDEYHWRDGIGPAAERRVRINANWGGVTEPNSFGTHEFMDFLEQIDAELFLSVNIGSGTVQEAADWLEYMTASAPSSLALERAANGRKEPWKVKYLGLGNENWGCGGAMSADHYVEEMKRFARFARFARNYNPAQKDAAKMIRVAVGWDSLDSDYTEAVMKAWKAKVWSWDIESVSLHNYTVAGWPPSYASIGFGETEYAKLVKDTWRMETLIAKQTAIMDRYDPEKRISLSVDEWGVWLAPLPGSNPGFLQQQNSLRDAIIAAINFNIFMRHADRVRVANIAQMVNVLQAMILTDGPKMVLTPTYYIHRMYLPFQDATLVPVSFDAGTYRHGTVEMPRVDAVAARDTSGQLWLALTNVDPNQSVEIRANIAGVRAKSARGEVLTAAEVASVNSFDAPNTVVPKPFAGKVRDGLVTLNLPAKSVVVFRVES